MPLAQRTEERSRKSNASAALKFSVSPGRQIVTLGPGLSDTGAAVAAWISNSSRHDTIPTPTGQSDIAKKPAP